jgi:colanic acid biosynthesis glycosyl transferase WcaI
LGFARELMQLGFEVEVVTGFPNYPGGRVYPGYQIRPIRREVVGGVFITRIALYPSHDGSATRRVLNYLSFAGSSVLYMLLVLRRADVIYAYHPPLTVGIVAGIARFLRRIPVVYDIQDMWPDTLQATGMVQNERVLAVVARVCQWVYRSVDRIAVLSPGFKRILAERGVPERKIDIVYNWCDEEALTVPVGDCPAAFPQADKFRILFAGNMGKAQALDSVIEVAERLATSHPHVCFVFLGSGVETERLKQQVSVRQLANVLFMPRVAMTEVGAVLRAADALLVHLKDDPLFEITIPSKTQAYMAVGKPILMAVRGDAADLVEAAQCGICACPEDPVSLANAAIRMASLTQDERAAMGRRGQEFYRTNLSLSVGARHFARHFADLHKARTQRRRPVG